jgi:hypothetical protein
MEFALSDPSTPAAPNKFAIPTEPIPIPQRRKKSRRVKGQGSECATCMVAFYHPRAAKITTEKCFNTVRTPHDR